MNAPAPVVAVSVEHGVGVVELARPDKFNCLSMDVHRAIDAALDRFEQAGSPVRSVLIRAQGRHFCTGADLDEVLALRRRPGAFEEFVALGHAVMRRLEASPLPVVAACQGLSLAGGLELMLACDVVFAARDARFGDQHAQFGLVPGWGGSQRLTRLVGARRALDLFFSARWIDAATALDWGLVNYVCEPDRLAAESLDYCRALGERSRVGLATMKRLARHGLEQSPAHGLDLEEKLAPEAMRCPDVDEGLAAFQQRRKPAFGP